MRWNADAVSGTSLSRTNTGLDDVATAPAARQAGRALEREEIEAALSGLKVAALVDGFRGRPAGDRAALVDAVLAVQRFALDRADRLIELDVNPLIVRPAGRGVARGRRNMLAALCGLGIGVAVFLDGRPIGDTLVPTGPIGVMKVIGEDGVATTLDDLAGGAGILRRLDGDLRLTPETFPQVDRLLHEAIEGDRAGDPAISAEMARAGRAPAGELAERILDWLGN